MWCTALQQEIANRLGISSAGAGTRLFRARQQLRKALIGSVTSKTRVNRVSQSQSGLLNKQKLSIGSVD